MLYYVYTIKGVIYMARPKNKKVQANFRLATHIHENLEAVAGESGKTKTEVIEFLIKREYNRLVRGGRL